MTTIHVQQYMPPCVCVQTANEKSAYTRADKRKSQDSAVCEDAHKQNRAKTGYTTTTETMYFDSSSVSSSNTSTITLIVQRRWSDAGS